MHKTKLKVFDFDATLIDTPLPEVGKDIWLQKTGQEWPHKGWWGQADSLDLNVFDMPAKSEVIADYEIARADEDAYVIMLTGRLSKLSEEVKAVLDSKGLVFDEYRFNTGGSTDVVKMRTMDKLLKQYPSITSVALWDDRQSHIPIFEEWGKQHCESGRLKDFQITVVFSDHHK